MVINKAFTIKNEYIYIMIYSWELASGKLLQFAMVQMAHLVLCFTYIFDGDCRGYLQKYSDTMMGSIDIFNEDTITIFSCGQNLGLPRTKFYR